MMSDSRLQMNVKQLLTDYSLKTAALFVAERCLQLGENPVFRNHDLKALYDYYYHKLDQPLPRPGEVVLYYDPLDDHRPKPARVIESRDSMTLDRPKLVRCKCDDQILELQDQHIYLLLYW